MARVSYDEPGIITLTDADPSHLTPVCRAAEVPAEGGLRVVLPNSKVLAVFRVAGEYFVTDDECTHGNASLSEGEVEGDNIVCPYHLGAFCLRTGQPTMSPCSIPLRTYPAELRDDVVLAQVG